MSDKDNGGNAFPAQTGFKDYQGMTLRDYFAAKAMQAVIAASAEDAARRKIDPKQWAAMMVEASYGFADAMIAERAK